MLKKLVNFVRGKFMAAERSIRKNEKSNTVVEKSLSGDSNQSSVSSEKKQPSATQKKYRRPRPKKKDEAVEKKGWDISQFDVIPAAGKVRFHDFVIPAEIMHGIADLGFQYCTPVQAMTLEGTLTGSDAIGQAQTGTGKTAAFLITILSRLLQDQKVGQAKIGVPRALIIAPTRELVMQIAKDGQALSKYSSKTVQAVFGGMDYDKQQRAIEKQPVDIIVATPGRLLDFQRRRIVDLSQVEIMVIDEADRMLDMGFIPDVKKIVYSTAPKEQRQTLMFSATMTPDVRHLASQWCTKPINVEIEPDQVAVETVEQIVYLTTAQEKYSVLYNMLTREKLERVLVFTNRKDETRKLTERLMRNDISCAMLSGDVAQNKRTTTLEKFRAGQIKVLVATDVAGRGIHIDGISHVFNYTLPYEPDDYVHRIGRTGRAGQSGVAISFADEEGAFYLPEIEKYVGCKIHCIYPDASLVEPAPRGTMPKTASQGMPRKNQGNSRKGPAGKGRTPRRGTPHHRRSSQTA